MASLAQLIVHVGADARSFEKDMGKIERKMKGLSRSLGDVGSTLTRGVTVPIAAAVGTVVKFGADFEQAMTQSTAIMGDLSDDMRKDMEGAARDVAKTTKFSAAEAAESYFYLASAGMDAHTAVEALPRVAAFAQAGNFDMARATDLLTDAQSALSMTVDDVTQNMENQNRISDVLVKANTLANASVEEFAVSLTNKGAAALDLFNKDVEEGVAVLSVFADQGLKGQEAGTILARTLEGLGERSRESAEEFEALGIKVFDSEGEMRNMADIIGDMETAFEGMSTEQRDAELAALGFNERTRRGILTLMGNTEALKEYEEGLRDAAGTTDEVAEKQLDNFYDQLGLLKDQLIDVGLTIWESLQPIIEDSLMPALENLAEIIGRVAEWFSNLDEDTQKMIFTIIGIVAAIGPLLMALSFIIKTVSGVIGIIKLLAGAFTFLLSPIGLVIAAVVAAIAIGWLLYNNWDKVVDFLTGLWESFSSWFQGLWDGIRDHLSGIWDSVSDKVSSTWDGIKGAIKAAINAIIGFINAIPAGIESAINAVSGAINNLPSFTVPDWVPHYGGRTFSMPNIPTISLGRVPTLHSGTDYFVPSGGGREGLALLERGEKVIPRGESSTVHHTFDPITIEGVNDQGQFIAAARAVIGEIMSDEIHKGDKRLANRARIVPY